MSVTALRPRVTLGGSTAAAACGVDPYTSAVELWARMTGRMTNAATEAMLWGRRLESVVVDELGERGYDVAAGNGVELKDPERPWLVGHPDGFVALELERALLEVKAESHWSHVQNAGVPLHHAAQVQTYLHLSGLRRGLLAVLVGGARLELHEVARDERAIALLLEGMERFLRHVRDDDPPPPDGSESARRTLLELEPTATAGRAHRLVGEEWRVYKELRLRREQRAAIDAHVAELENLLRAAIGDAEVAVSPFDSEVATYRNVTSRRIDTKALREQRPHIAELFEREQTSRRLLLK